MPSPLLVFDLDGTLVDTAPDLVDTLNVVFAREGVPAVPYDEARMMIGGGAKAMLVCGIEAEGRAATPELLDRLLADFLAYYADHIAVRSRPTRSGSTRIWSRPSRHSTPATTTARLSRANRC